MICEPQLTRCGSLWVRLLENKRDHQTALDWPPHQTPNQNSKNYHRQQGAVHPVRKMRLLNLRSLLLKITWVDILHFGVNVPVAKFREPVTDPISETFV